MNRSSRSWAIATVLVFIGMVGMSYAAVPLYGMFCRATGYGGTTQVATKKSDRVVERPIEVRFDTNVAPGLALEFSADQRLRTLNLGETALVFFKVKNNGPLPVQAVATYNVIPQKTGIYFQKLECFCFQPRVFAPGETLELPVVFYVDPLLMDDRETREVQQITLSYTYFADPKAAKAPIKTAAAEPGRDVARP